MQKYSDLAMGTYGADVSFYPTSGNSMTWQTDLSGSPQLPHQMDHFIRGFYHRSKPDSFPFLYSIYRVIHHYNLTLTVLHSTVGNKPTNLVPSTSYRTEMGWQLRLCKGAPLSRPFANYSTPTLLGYFVLSYWILIRNLSSVPCVMQLGHCAITSLVYVSSQFPDRLPTYDLQCLAEKETWT